MLVQVKRFLVQLVTVLFLFQLARFIFVVANNETFSTNSVSDLLYLFGAATRFDLSAFAYANLLFVLLYFLPGNFKYNRYYSGSLNVLFVAVNAILIIPNIADIEYFKYTKSRSSVFVLDMLGLGKEGTSELAIIFSFLSEYWYWTLLWLSMFTTIMLVSLRTQKAHPVRPYKFKHFMAESGILLLFLGLTVLAARGGFQLKPISEINAAEYAGQNEIPIVLNSAFTIMKSVEATKLEPKNFFEQAELDKIKNAFVEPKNPNAVINKQNVVVLILESFSKEYIGFLSGKQTYTPFLDSLLGQSLVFPNAYANGSRSVEAVPSIIAGIPSLSATPFVTSPYSNNRFGSLTENLGSKGYATAFFHGGNRGTMGFDAFARITDCQHIFDKETYPNPNHFDGKWGIFDLPFMQYSIAEMSKLKQPFFSYIFTLSSHHPYTLPPEYKDSFPEVKSDILKAVRYTDVALRQFFESAKKTNWFANTLFVITADHTGRIIDKKPSNITQPFEIPIAFFHRTDAVFKAKIDSTIAQHIDIMPTVLEYLNYSEPYFALGESLLSPPNNKIALTYLSGTYQAIGQNYVLTYTDDANFQYYRLDKQSAERKLHSIEAHKIHTGNEMMKQLKARIQIFNNNMINNLLMAK